MLDTIILAVFLCLGYFSPLALASIDIWSQTVIHICSVLIGVLFILKFWHKKTCSLHLPFWQYMLVWSGIYYCSYIFSANKSMARMDLFNMINAVFLFYCAANIKSVTGKTDTMLRRWGYIVFVLGLVTCYQLYIHYGSTEEPSSMINQNILAGYLMFWMPYWFGKAIACIRSKNTPGIIVSVAASLITTISIVSTHSVTAWAALYAAFFIVYFILEHNRYFKIFNIKITAMHMLVILLIFVLIAAIKGTIILSVYERIRWAAVAGNMAVKNPLLGVGPGGFSDAFLFFKNGSFQNTLYAHNILFHMMAEIGFAGTAVFVLLLYSILKLIKQNYTIQIRLMTIGFIAFIIKSMFDYSFSIPANYFIFFIWAGLIISMIRDSSVPLRIPGVSKSAIVLTLLILTIFVPGIVRLFSVSRSVARGRWNVAEKQYQTAEELFHEASFVEPFFPEPYYELSRMYYHRFLDTNRIVFIEIAIVYIEKSLRFNKFNRHYHSIRTLYRTIHRSHPDYI